MSDVWPGGPAEEAGLKVGDILVSVDGQPADNLPTVNYNFRLRDSTENVQLVVLRGGKEQVLSVATVEQRSDLDSVSSMADPEKNLVPELGILGVEIDPRIAAGASGLSDPYGIIVVARAAGATTEVPLQPRDVIRSVNNRRSDAAGAEGRGARAQAWHAGDVADSARGKADVRVVHARLTAGFGLAKPPHLDHHPVLRQARESLTDCSAT